MPKKKAKNKHGVYSSKVLLPGEKQADYEALRQSYFDEWVPDGVTEQYLVDDLCKLRWKKLRLERYDQVCLQQRKDKILLENNANKLIEELRGMAEEFSETESIEEVEGILAWLSASISMLINKWVPRDKCTEPAKWGQEIGDYLSKLKQVKPLKGADLFAAIVDPGLMEIEIARSTITNKLIEELRGLAEEFSETESIEEVEGILPWLSAGYLWGGKKLKRKSANISRSFHPQPTSTTKNLPFMA